MSSRLFKADMAGKLSVLSTLSRMAFNLIFLLLASILTASNGLIIDCSFTMNDWGYNAGSVYTCQVTANMLDNNEAITMVTDSTASADPTLQTSDVKWIYLSNGYNLKIEQFPSNMATIFPNLIGISWSNSKLRMLKPSDLASYPNLIYLSLGQNMIRKLEGNTFQNNHQLQYLDLSMNAIQEVGTGLLNGLNSLIFLQIQANICTGQGQQFYLSPYSTIADISRALDFVCGPSTETSEPSGPCDPCLANCTARAAALQIRVDAITESVYAPWFYKLRSFFKAVSMW